MTLDEVSLLLLGYNCNISAFLTLVATTAPQTWKTLLAVRPDMAKVLAVLALRKTSLSSVQAIQLEQLLRFYISC
jgi:hypothetical protein